MRHSEKSELTCNWNPEREVKQNRRQAFYKDQALELSKIVERPTDSRTSINQKQYKIKEHRTSTHHSKSVKRQRQRANPKSIHRIKRHITFKRPLK